MQGKLLPWQRVPLRRNVGEASREATRRRLPWICFGSAGLVLDRFEQDA